MIREQEKRGESGSEREEERRRGSFGVSGYQVLRFVR
jgi:hypothetical protein